MSSPQKASLSLKEDSTVTKSLSEEALKNQETAAAAQDEDEVLSSQKDPENVIQGQEHCAEIPMQENDPVSATKGTIDDEKPLAGNDEAQKDPQTPIQNESDPQEVHKSPSESHKDITTSGEPRKDGQSGSGAAPRDAIKAPKGAKAIHKCEICGVVISTGTNLTRHTRTMHGVDKKKKLKCEWCPRTYDSQYYFLKHVENVHGLGKAQKIREQQRVRKVLKNVQFACHVCDFICTSKELLQTHLKGAHEKQIFVPPLLTKTDSEANKRKSQCVLIALGGKKHKKQAVCVPILRSNKQE